MASLWALMCFSPKIHGDGRISSGRSLKNAASQERNTHGTLDAAEKHTTDVCSGQEVVHRRSRFRYQFANWEMSFGAVVALDLGTDGTVFLLFLLLWLDFLFQWTTKVTLFTGRSMMMLPRAGTCLLFNNMLRLWSTLHVLHCMWQLIPVSSAASGTDGTGFPSSVLETDIFKHVNNFQFHPALTRDPVSETRLLSRGRQLRSKNKLFRRRAFRPGFYRTVQRNMNRGGRHVFAEWRFPRLTSPAVERYRTPLPEGKCVRIKRVRKIHTNGSFLWMGKLKNSAHNGWIVLGKQAWYQLGTEEYLIKLEKCVPVEDAAAAVAEENSTSTNSTTVNGSTTSTGGIDIDVIPNDVNATEVEPGGGDVEVSLVITNTTRTTAADAGAGGKNESDLDWEVLDEEDEDDDEVNDCRKALSQRGADVKNESSSSALVNQTAPLDCDQD